MELPHENPAPPPSTTRLFAVNGRGFRVTLKHDGCPCGEHPAAGSLACVCVVDATLHRHFPSPGRCTHYLVAEETVDGESLDVYLWGIRGGNSRTEAIYHALQKVQHMDVPKDDIRQVI